MRILVTGSRAWQDVDAIVDALDEAYFGSQCQEPVTVVHGGCPDGADIMAAAWIRRTRDAGWAITEERHPADWQKHGKAAGFRRNAEMVDAGADLCLAFINPCSKRGCPDPQPHGSHGASHTADLAEKAGIPVRRFPARDTRGGDAA
ncbi:SLOG family protein [Actinomadura rubrisoli]|uniref:DUF2493 domain-containing protein n=1 Tax=Actinomadura rubrisoli TaxID=2530368 RepID=A0A4R5CDK2_9ACTN|nr:SLOG family protein [Actinomadura rubrisoli]TDD97595.1 DUF2493 domain-containing protein [Actinomadura rubrisoli]